MKKSHIILLIVLLVVIAVIIGTIHDSSTYADFNQAKSRPETTFQIIGKLNKKKEIIYDSTLLNQSLTFYMIDEKNNECKVTYYGQKPTDFNKLEQVVVTGSMEHDVFIAKEMLLKCPSKYTKSDDDMKTYSSKENKK